MDSIETLLDQAAKALNQLYGLPAGLLVLVSCIVVGYVLRLVKRFPNDGIPVVVILWGGAFLPLLADIESEMPWRVWFVKNLLVGLTIGLAAWLLHNKVISKIEDRFAMLFPGAVGTPRPTQITETTPTPETTRPKP